MPGVISIEGNLGAGKTTLLSLLSLLPTIREPVEQWTNTAGSNVLQRYYCDPQRWAFTFQLHALHSRLRLWRAALSLHPQALLLAERSPAADRHIFGELMRSEGNMDACEFAIYDAACASLLADCPLAAVVYLRCAPAVCLQRIRERGRPGEEAVSLEYLQKVHDRHEAWISREQSARVLTLDTAAYDLADPEHMAQLLQTLTDFISKLQ